MISYLTSKLRKRNCFGPIRKLRKIRGDDWWMKLVKTSDEFVIYFVHFIPFCLVWSKTKLIVHIVAPLPKRPIKQFKPVQQSSWLWAYCPNIYTVIKGDQWLVAIWNTPMIQFQPTNKIRISTGKFLIQKFERFVLWQSAFCTGVQP